MRWSLLSLLLACEDTEKPIPVEETILLDEDSDGFSSDEDCDDNDALVFPSAEEICDGIDNDCNDQIDEGVTSTFYADSDGDGFGNPAITLEACEITDGFVSAGTDCDDGSAISFPSAEEICDGIDNDCNGEIDEELAQTFYTDNDGDGFGDENNPVEACELDLGLSVLAGDCDDTSSQISPVVNETCDGIDNDCDGTIDNGVLTTYYYDSDEDGYGDDDSSEEACEAAENYITIGGDCDDIENHAYPNAIEICDGIDNNCDGVIDEADAAGEVTFYADNDGDGHGDSNSTILDCSAPAGYVSDADDCDDGDASQYPGALEYCNSEDDNCDGVTDEDSAVDVQMWYADFDSDGFGDAINTTFACSTPMYYTTDNTDCDDQDDDNYPSAPEICDSEDNDCDGVIDETDAVDAISWYSDNDGDGYGDDATAVLSCSVPAGSIAVGGDCNDGESTISPSTQEICNGVDNDCDGTIDNDPNDGDCDGISAGLDCDDGDPAILSLLNDQDCDGVLTADDCDDSDSNVSVEENGMFSDCAAAACQAILDDGFSLGSGAYWLDPDSSGDSVEVYCDMTTEGVAWTDVVQSFHLSGADVTALADRFFLVTASSHTLSVDIDTGVSSGASGLLFEIDGTGTHGEGFHLIAQGFTYTQTRISYQMQGSNDNNRCATSNWIPLSGPGYNGGYGGYYPSCISGYTCLYGSSTFSRDAPISVSYSNNAFDNTTELLTWSHSDYNAASTGCARDADIPSDQPATFITNLLIR